MNSLEVFRHDKFGQIRAVDIDGTAWLVGKDAAAALGYTNTRDSLSRHVDEEDRADVVIHDGRQKRRMIVINESGFYSLVLSSKLKAALEFKRWVTSDVLPAIRKHGFYAVSNVVEDMLSKPDFAIQLLQRYKEEQTEKEALAKKIEEDKPKVDFADSVTTSNTTILIGDLAKILRQNGVDIGQKRLFEYLRSHGYLMINGWSRNMPTQRAADMGLFFVKETTVNNPDGSIRLTKTTKVTGKGQIYFINKFLTQKNTFDSIAGHLQ
jgi:anti-repressor protein